MVEFDGSIFTRCVGAGRVKRLSSCVCVCDQKTQLFTILPLENRHKIALYRSVLQFVSLASLLSSAMAMVSNSCIVDNNITVTGCVRTSHDEPERALQ